MKKCPKCGKELKNNQKFCSGCGHNVASGGEEKKSSSASTTGSKGNNQPNKTVVTVLILLVILAIGGFFGYRYLEDHYSRRNQVDRLVEVLESEDHAEIASILSPGERDFEFDEESIAPFVEGVVSEMDFSDVRRDLAREGEHGTLELSRDGSHFFLFDRYVLELTPSYALLATNMSDVTLLVNGEEVVTSDEEYFTYEYGPFVPGEHQFSARTELNGEELTVENDMTILPDHQDPYVDLSLQALSFYVYSNVSEASVYLDDEEIGQLEYGEGEFGPYASLEGATLHLGYEEEFGEMTTESISLDNMDNQTYTLDFADALTIDEAYEVIEDMYNTLSSLTSTFNVSSASRRFEGYFNDGTAFDELRPFFTDYAERQRDNDDVNYVDFDVELSNFEQVDYAEYIVDLEVDYRTVFSDWDEEDRVRTFTYSVSLVADEAERNTFTNDQEFFINGFSDEEMIYDSHE